MKEKRDFNLIGYSVNNTIQASNRAFLLSLYNVPLMLVYHSSHKKKGFVAVETIKKHVSIFSPSLELVVKKGAT